MKRTLSAAVAMVGAAALVFGFTTAATAHHGKKAGMEAGVKAKAPLNQLVTAGTITQAEADAFRAAMQAAAKANREAAQAAKKAARDQALAQLVAAGTITQASADLIKAGGKALKDAVKAGTVTYAQLGAVRDAMLKVKADLNPVELVKTVTAQLVDQGKLSAGAAAAISAALPAKVGAKQGGLGKGFPKGHGKKGHGMKGMRS